MKTYVVNPRKELWERKRKRQEKEKGEKEGIV